MKMTTAEINEIKKALKTKLDDIVNDLFLDFQIELGIDNGDITPDEFFDLDNKTEEIADIIAQTLAHQTEHTTDPFYR